MSNKMFKLVAIHKHRQSCENGAWQQNEELATILRKVNLIDENNDCVENVKNVAY